MKHINQFDLALVVDTTASMSHLIHAAQTQLVQVIDALAQGSDVDMQLAGVDALADRIGSTPPSVASAVSRLQSRALL